MHIFANIELGFGNKTMATYGNISTTGGGSRYGINLGAQYMLPCRHNGHNMVSAALGISSVTLKDNFKDKGPAGAVNNEYHLSCVSLPIMITTTFYGSRKAKGLYLRTGATLDYAWSTQVNQKEMNGTINKFGFVPLFSFGYVGVYDYETRFSSGTSCLMLGPFVSYNVMNMLNVSGSTLNYFTFGITYTGIRF